MIFEPRVEDEGTYKCEAVNELGKVSYEVSLYVEMSEFFCCIVIVIVALPVFCLFVKLRSSFAFLSYLPV